MYKSYSTKSPKALCDFMNNNNVIRANIISLTDAEGWYTLIYWATYDYDD